jgi:hypothetical protein
MYVGVCRVRSIVDQAPLIPRQSLLRRNCCPAFRHNAIGEVCTPPYIGSGSNYVGVIAAPNAQATPLTSTELSSDFLPVSAFSVICAEDQDD